MSPITSPITSIGGFSRGQARRGGFFPALTQYAPESLSVESRGGSTAVLRMKAKDPGKTFFASAAFEINLKSHLITRMSFLDQAGREQMSIRFDAVEFDRPIPESRFAFSGIDGLPIRALKDIERKHAKKE